MTDSYGRTIDYLRLSVTDLCDLRCRYCMDETGVCKKSHTQMLTQEEMLCAVRAAASLGFHKLRITGGEPLVKPNLLPLCNQAAKIPGIRDIAITTNGTRLPELAAPLRQAGVKRINLSLDTLQQEKYAFITQRGSLDDALRGLDAALQAEFEKVKINTVLIGGVNDDEIGALAALTCQYPVDVRFIELMPMTENHGLPRNAYLPVDAVTEALPQLQALGCTDGVARLYRLPGALGNVGLISPVSSHFCGSCNRLRLTADGKLKPCLHDCQEFSLKGLDEKAMVETFAKAIAAKPACHGALGDGHLSDAGRFMNQIGG